jgi:hypothetical protein
MPEMKGRNDKKKILLAVDASEFSEGAVREALNLARVTGGELLVLSVAEINPELLAHSPEISEALEQKTVSTLKEVSARAEKESVKCETIFHEGEEPYRFIVEEAGKRGADVIVMGRRGRRGLMKLMMGSVTALVIGHSPCNVFVVPRAGELKFKNLLLCTDGSEYSLNVAKEAFKIAKEHGSSLMAISVASREEELDEAKTHLGELEKAALAEGLKIETIAVTGTPYETITTTAQVKKADLIVVGTHGRTGIKKLLMGSVAERVIALAHCSVLVVK